jgi:hypothetical protein
VPGAGGGVAACAGTVNRDNTTAPRAAALVPSVLDFI